MKSSVSGLAASGASHVAGAATAAVVEANGSRRTGRHDNSPLHAGAEAVMVEPKDPDAASPGYRTARHEGLEAHEDDGHGEARMAGGVPLIANKIATESADRSALGPERRKRAAQAYAYGINAVTRNPRAPGVIFDNIS